MVGMDLVVVGINGNYLFGFLLLLLLFFVSVLMFVIGLLVMLLYCRFI